MHRATNHRVDFDLDREVVALNDQLRLAHVSGCQGLDLEFALRQTVSPRT
jgi:hypothetical protein